MIGIILVSIGMLIAIVVGFVWWVGADSESDSLERINQEMADTNAAIDREYREARRAMNDAAGQSWRNLIE